MTNSPSFPPLFPGMLLDAAARFAQDNATTDLRASHTVRDMGWACTLVPEDAGGVGGSFADLAAVIEGLATARRAAAGDRNLRCRAHPAAGCSA
jgi:alkylation response protein AidB-like acyl-CoA dehydrogenase